MATTERQGFKIVEGKAPNKCPVQFCRCIPHRERDLCSRHKMQAWRKANPMQAAFKATQWSAKKRSIAFIISFDDFAAFCTENDYLNRKGPLGEALQIDRKDPEKGYEAGNLQVLTATENQVKGNRERWLRHQLPLFR